VPVDRSGRGKTLRGAIIGAVPPRAIAAVMCRLYPRVEPELARLVQYMPRGGTAVDVGAWYGPWTRRMAKIADRVVSIEAHPELAELLRHTVPGAKVWHAAASDSRGEIALNVPPAGPALGLSSVEGADGGTSVMVPRIAIDDLHLDAVTFIKMDVEGHEYAALLGASATIAKHRPLVLLELEERMQDVDRVVDLLGSWGYTGFVQPERTWIPLAGFDLVRHQRAAIRRVHQSFVRRLVWSRPRYVNMVLFRPDRVPS
jgi:FkbM family methyltransferase